MPNNCSDSPDTCLVRQQLEEQIKSEVIIKCEDLLFELQCFQNLSVGELSASALERENQIAEELLEMTRTTYDKICRDYSALRGAEPAEQDKKILAEVIEVARNRVCCSQTKDDSSDHDLILLDVGTAYGRDIKYGSKVPGLRIIGIDNSDGFIEILREMEKKQEIPPGSFRKADMRDLSCFPDGSFDIVRYHASLHHLPMIGKGYMADKALSEGYRVLKSSGIIYISVKQGSGIKYDDTQEGLGKFLCQYHSAESISILLKRNHFKEIRLSERPSSRGKHISWISIIAEKGGPERNDSGQQ